MSTRQEREALNREYLKSKVDMHLNKLIIELLKKKPDDVLAFIVQWGQDQVNKGRDGAPAKEEEAPAPAPAEEKAPEAPAPVEEKAPEAPVEEAPAPEVKPEAEAEPEAEPEPEAADENYEAPDVDSEEEEEGDDEVMDLEAFAAQAKPKTKNRESVSAEVFGVNNLKKEYIPTVIEKSEEAKERIRTRLGQSFMFASLEEKEKTIVLNAMAEHQFKKDDVVIKQGDDGDVLYCLDSGALACHRMMNKEAEYPGTFLKTYVPGEAFGELALLYNAPRAATIIATEDSCCFSLDRACFNSIVKDATVKRRERFEEFLNKIELLNDLDTYDKGQLSDVLQIQNVAEGEYVITEGEKGDKFFLIEAGTANALKKNTESGDDDVVFQYKENDYFGELALLRDDVRQASIVATSAMTLAWIDRAAFKRLLGSLESILQKNEEKYKQFVMNSA